MFFKFNDKSVRLTGRWAELPYECVAATATGAYIEFAFRGKMALMHFNTDTNAHPFLHLWISVDRGAMIETPLDDLLRIVTDEDKNHVVKVIFKGGVEIHHRWYPPLAGVVCFKGFEADCAGELPTDDRNIIEFVGDSITEGVLIDDNEITRKKYRINQHCRVYQDDVCATYAYLTANALDLRPVMMGYGAVGVTCSGQGAVPPAYEAYPFAFYGHEAKYDIPDYILINHGANDMGKTQEEYINGYEKLLDVITKKHPASKLIALSAFYGVYPNELETFIGEYNKKHNKDIYFINSTGWIPREPLHPLREGHKAVADKLIPILKNIISAK